MISHSVLSNEVKGEGSGCPKEFLKQKVLSKDTEKILKLGGFANRSCEGLTFATVNCFNQIPTSTIFTLL